jgi:hypothetical protein
MSNQNATLNAQTTQPIESFDYAMAVSKAAERKLGINGLTTSAHTLNRLKLVSSVCASVRNAYPSVFAKRDEQGNILPESSRLPEDIYNKVCVAVDEYIGAAFDKFKASPDELVKVSTRFVHLAKKQDVILRHTIQRDEVIALKERKFGIVLFIGETERCLAKLNEQRSTWSEATFERVAKLEKRLALEQKTLERLTTEISKQAEVSK